MVESENNAPSSPKVNSSTGSDAEEQLIDYTNHEAAEVGVLNRLWYKEAVFYEMYVRAFCDLEGTGNGGITGITSRLDYLHYLGVDCIWLLPIYPSPLKDDGYDVADYCDIHPDYGNIEDFKTLVAAVHERNMKIIVDFIPNHCSEKHRWFQEARKDRNSPYRDYFVWTDDIKKYQEARIIFLDVEPSNWTYDEVAGQYYWHRFFKEQPDLNFDNPKVQDEMLNTMKFWLDIGIDGFRVDAVPYLFERDGTSCENLPETHDFLRRMRKFVDDNYPGRVMLAEACQMPHEVRKYFGETGDEFHMGFHFPVMPRIYMSIKREDGTCLKEIMENTPNIPPNCQWVTFLRNHDELTLEMVTPEERKWMWEKYAPEPRMKLNLGIRRRLAPLLDNDQRQIELAYSLLFTLPGSPIIYYGDEIGMGDNIWLEDRHGVRTPMQWTPEGPHGGFSPAPKIYAPVIKDEVFGFQRVNVDLVTKDPSSIYHVIRTMINRRRTHLAFGHGDFHWARSSTPAVASFLRTYGIDRLLCVHNLSSKPQETTIFLPPSEYRSTAYDIRTSKGIELPNHSIFDILTDLPSTVTQTGTLQLVLEPYQYLWLNLGEMRQLGDTTQKPVSSRRGSIVPPPMELIRSLSGSNVLTHMDAISEDPDD
jgi:trehalose synthase